MSINNKAGTYIKEDSRKVTKQEMECTHLPTSQQFMKVNLDKTNTMARGLCGGIKILSEPKAKQASTLVIGTIMSSMEREVTTGQPRDRLSQVVYSFF